MSSTSRLHGEHGNLDLQARGGMIGPADFALPGLSSINPLTCPQWRDDPGSKDWLPLIRNLCGDFVCAPYGAPRFSENLPDDWKRDPALPIAGDSWFHGHGPNNLWEVWVDQDNPASGGMRCRLPRSHPFSEISRRVRLLADGPGYEVDLSIIARSDVVFPLSLHPCFVLPDQPGSLELHVMTDGPGWTYPVSLIQSNAPVALNSRFASLEQVPLVEGSMLDMTSLPPEYPCESLVQIAAPAGEVKLHYVSEGYELLYGYDAGILPSLVIWLSNCGRQEAPFSGNFRTLGLEAVAGAFDLGPQISCSDQNPMAREGLKTCLRLAAGEEFVTTSTVRMRAHRGAGPEGN